MTRPTRPDQELNEIGADLDALSARYHADSKGIEPPQPLDAQVLAAAHRAVDAKPRVAGSTVSPSWSLMRRMRAPFGLAATIVAVASITVILWQESPEKLAIPSDHAAVIAAKKAPASEGSSSAHNEVAGRSPQDYVPAPAAAAVAPAAPAAQAPGSPSHRSQAKVEAQKVERTRAALSSPGAPLPAAAVNKITPAGVELAADARAKAAQPERSEHKTIDRVTVTGSNFRRADTETPSPVQAFDQPLASAAPAPPPPASAAAPLVAAPVARASAVPEPPAQPAIALPAPRLQTAPTSAPPPPPAAAMPAPAGSPAPALPARANSARQFESTPAPSAALAAAAPSAPSARLAVPNAAPDIATTTLHGEASLLGALQIAADAGDAAAARLVLETLRKNYPQSTIPAALRAELNRMGISLPEAR